MAPFFHVDELKVVVARQGVWMTEVNVSRAGL